MSREFSDRFLRSWMMKRALVHLRRVGRGLRIRVLDVYLVREFCIPLVFTMVAFTAILAIYILITELEDFVVRGMTYGEIFTYMSLNIPFYVVSVILPVSVLVGLLYCLTALARNNEIVAMRASGISLPRAVLPMLLVCLVITLGAMWANRQWVPQAFARSKEMLIKGERNEEGDVIRTMVQYYQGSQYRTWLIKKFNITKMTVEDVEILEQDAEFRDLRKIYARRGRWEGDLWRFEDVRIVDWRQEGRQRDAYASSLVLEHFFEKPRQILSSGREMEGMSAGEIREYLDKCGGRRGRKTAPYLTQFHYRYALPWGCMAVALFTIPFAGSATRRNPVEGIVFPLGFFVAMFFLTNFSLALGTGYRIPGWLAAWLPNMVFGGLGVWAFWWKR